MKRFTLVTTILGSVLLVFGGIVLASTVAGGGDQGTRTAGMLAISFAGMIIAVPMYIEARRLQTEVLDSKVKKGKTRGAIRCGGCGMDTAAFWCTTHTVRLCADCVPKHDEPSRCLYKSLLQIAPAAKRAAAAGR